MGEPITGAVGEPALVDVHTHLYTPSYARYLMDRKVPPMVVSDSDGPRFTLFPGDLGVPFDESFTSVEAKLRFMDDNSITHSVVSLGNPWLDLDPGPSTVELAATVNQELAEVAAHRSGRLACLGILPNHQVEDAVEALGDIERLGLVGVVVGTAIAGHPLGADALEPVWAAAAGRGLPFLVHPQAGLGKDETQGYGQALTLGMSFPFETSVAIFRLVLSGVFRRHEDLRVIAAHGGGTVPYLTGRVARALAVDPAPLAKGADASLPDGLLVDSIVHSAEVLRLCLRTLGTDRIVFGTDHPFPIADPAGSLADLRAADLALEVISDNARRLFPAAWGVRSS